MSEIDRAAIRDMRRSYGEAGLEESKVAQDPITQFHTWLTEAAGNAVIVEANAMVLSTVVDSHPTSRTVLLKDVTESGFSFFSNYESGKGKALQANPNVSLVFPWYAMERQVIILGSVTKLPATESDNYFATRPWGSQIGAWASAECCVQLEWVMKISRNHKSVLHLRGMKLHLATSHLIVWQKLLKKA